LSNDDDKVFRFGSIQGGKTEEKDDGIPVDNYRIIDIDDEEWTALGFMVFTPHHLAIMRDYGNGAVPVIVLPLDRVKAGGLVPPDEEDTETEELPF
jgi:hypothetical protein